MSRSDSQSLRDMLADVGIDLDEESTELVASKPSKPPESDRERIREILVEAGAPHGHLAWLVASCPSVSDSLTYRK